MVTVLASIQLGNLATWVAAIATAGTLGVSLYLLTKQRRELHELHLEKRAEQARLVSAWPLDLHRSTDVGTKTELVFGYRNGSPQPAYAVAVGTRDRTTTSDMVWEVLGTLGPGKEGTGMIPLPLNPEFNLSADDVGIVLTFRDTAGRIWYRDEVGNLQELDAYPAPEPWVRLPSSTRARPTPPPQPKGTPPAFQPTVFGEEPYPGDKGPT